MNQEFGIIIFNLGDGDFVVDLVDKARFEQIDDLSKQNLDKTLFEDIADWLTSDFICSYSRAKSKKPNGFPERIGKLLKEVECRTLSVEHLEQEIEGKLIGFLFI
jgi:hypothetical protein